MINLNKKKNRNFSYVYLLPILIFKNNHNSFLSDFIYSVIRIKIKNLVAFLDQLIRIWTKNIFKEFLKIKINIKII